MIEDYLLRHGIAFKKFEHPAVFTCEESSKLPCMPGFSTKNIFLYDSRSESHALVVVGHDKKIDLKELKNALGWSKISFAPAERLKQFLGVEPGSVTLLGLLNDTQHAVSVYFDTSVAQAEFLQCHPLINTATIVLSQEGVRTFFRSTGHALHVLDIPAKR